MRLLGDLVRKKEEKNTNFDFTVEVFDFNIFHIFKKLSGTFFDVELFIQ
jgi:hypothetical protein